MILTRALQALRPGIEFTYNDEDLSSIVWSIEGTTTPTQSQINAKIAELEEENSEKILAKQSAKEKLLALGLTEQEISALVGI
jgi:hypothetical protein